MDEAYKEKYEKNKNESWNQMTAYKKSSELLTTEIIIGQNGSGIPE